MSHTKATTALQLNPYTYQSLFGFLVHCTPRITPQLPVTQSADERSNKTEVFRNVNSLRVQLSDNSLPQKYSTAAQPANLNVVAQTAIVLHTNCADSQTRWTTINTRNNSPTLTWSHGRTPGWTSCTLAAASHHLHHTPRRPTCQQRQEVLSAHTGGVVTFKSEYAATHSLKYKLRTQDPSFIRQLRL